MALNFNIVMSDIESHTARMADFWKTQRADWGFADPIEFANINTTRIWKSLDEATPLWNASEQRRWAKRNKLPSKRFGLIQLPLAPIVDCSFAFGVERPDEPVYAIDGGDQTAYEFANGRRGGAGLATYGFVAIKDDRIVSKYPERKELQLVPADWWDLYNFALTNFKAKPKLPDAYSMQVRQYAAFRRQQFEWLRLSYLIDQVDSKTIILMDGALKAMFTPPTTFMHYVGKKAARKGVIILGVMKECKIDMWLHFQEYWASFQSNAWIRPPAPVLEAAYRSRTGIESNEFLSLGAKGRGIGLPIATVLSKLREYYYVIDFNVYDFVAARKFLYDDGYPETHAKNFPLVTPDRDFISATLAQVGYYANHVMSLGYPFPSGIVHQLVRITLPDVNAARNQAIATLLKRGERIEDLAFSEDPRKTLESF